MRLHRPLARLAGPIGLLLLAQCTTERPTSKLSTPREEATRGAVAGAVQVASSEMLEAPVAAPLTLTASDGSGLRLASLVGRAVVDGPLAFTELRLTFDNPQDRVIEGTFAMNLPAGASVSRFAMRIGDAWQEGEVVELQRAREAYEDALHRKQDPALLEQGAGNSFSARVFPIPARGTKEIIVSYSQELAGSAPYVLPLRGLPEVGVVDVTVSLAAGAPPALRLREAGYVPTADVVVPAGDPLAAMSAESRVTGLRSGSVVVLRVRPVATAPRDAPSSALVLFDTSASRALGFDREVARLKALLRALVASSGPALKVTVAVFDQSVLPVYEGLASGFGEREAARIRDRKALGASNLEGALLWAGASAKGPSPRYDRVIVITDGVATAGASDASALATALKPLGAAGVLRVDAIATGGLRDDALLRRLVASGLAHDGVVVDGTASAEAMAARLTRETHSNVPVVVEGARWFWPKKLDSVQAGDEALVYAELAEGAKVMVAVGGSRATEAALAPTSRPLLERAWAKAKIDSLLASDRAATPSKETRDAVVALSLAHRVTSPFTALLVLETEADYARFAIDRRRVAEVMTVGDGRVVTSPREKAPALEQDAPRTRAKGEWGLSLNEGAGGGAPPEPPAKVPGGATGDAVGDSFGAGGLGLSGIGQGGGGSAQGEGHARGEGIGLGSIGTVGHGAGAGTGTGASFGSGHGRLAAEEVEADRVPEGAGRDALARRAVETRFREESPYTGRFATVMKAIEDADAPLALRTASAWQAEAPGDVMAETALGEALEATHDYEEAARAYGSIIDLFPSRADLRRFAGNRLERVAKSRDGALDLAVDTYEKAEAERPDHPESHRLLAFALLKKGEYTKAFEAGLAGLTQKYPSGRFADVKRVLAEDLGLLAAAWERAEPARREEIHRRLLDAGGVGESNPSLRFVLSWETDANDVDFHITDAEGNHAFYSHPELATGGSLYADVTTGYGPECFTIRGPRARRSASYRLRAQYYSRGPMGFGMGKVEVIDHDGKGNVTFDERPFVVMADRAFVDLGTVTETR